MSPALEKISKETLRIVLASDFVQASEAEIVGSVIRWGEVMVARRGEGGANYNYYILELMLYSP